MSTLGAHQPRAFRLDCCRRLHARHYATRGFASSAGLHRKTIGQRQLAGNKHPSANLVEPMLKQNPASGNLFVFVVCDRSKVKCLYWDRTGFALWYKRLEHGRFPSPTLLAERGFTLAELNAWLEGIEIPACKPHHNVCVARVS